MNQSCASNALPINPSQGCEQGATLGLCGANACDAARILRFCGLHVDRLKIVERPARGRTVEGALYRVPGKLVGHTRILFVYEDTPATVIHANEIDAYSARVLFAHVLPLPS